MTISTTVKVVGARDTIRSLSKIDRATRRQFTKDAQKIVAPVIDEAVNQYPVETLSGMARVWKVNGRQLFPYDRRRAIRGLKVKVDTSVRANSVIKLVQTNPAAAIYENAGKRQSNPLGNQLTRKFTAPMRLLWPIAERKTPAIQDEMRALVLEASRLVQKELR